MLSHTARLKDNLLKAVAVSIFFFCSEFAVAASGSEIGSFSLTFEYPYQVSYKPNHPSYKVSAAKKTPSHILDSEKLDWECDFSFGSVLDTRENKETIGSTIYFVPLKASEVDSWLEDYREYLNDVLPGDADRRSEGSVIVNLELVRLYTYVRKNTIFGLIAVKLVFKDDIETREMHLRGYSATKVSQFIPAYSAAINKASHDLASRIVDTLAEECRRREVPA